MREYGLLVDDRRPLHDWNNEGYAHSIIIPEKDITLKLERNGPTSYLSVRRPNF